MKLSDFTGKPCNSRLAYEFLPNKKIRIDLEKAAIELKEIVEVEVNSKVLLMVKSNNLMISIFPSGKILVRGEKDSEKAKKTAEKVIASLKTSVLEQ